MDRYYVSTSGGRGWTKAHCIYDRATVPHTCLGPASGVPFLKTASQAAKVCAALNANGEFWTAAPAERDSLTRLRDWAARTKAFTEAAYDPSAPVALVREAA